MRIYSADSWMDLTAEVPYDVNLPQISKDFWQPTQEVIEAAYLATTTAQAGMFRQTTKYDISSVKKTYTIVLSEAESTVLTKMNESTQSEWIVDTGNGRYLCLMVIVFNYSEGRRMADMTFHVLSRE